MFSTTWPLEMEQLGLGLTSLCQTIFSSNLPSQNFPGPLIGPQLGFKPNQ